MLPYIIYFSETLPFIFCIYFFKKNISKDLKVFFVYTLILFISIIIHLTFRYIIKSYPSFLIFNRFYLIAEFALISLFFIHNIIHLKIKKIIRLLIIPFLLFSLYDYLSSLDQEFTYYPLVMECLLFPLIIILFFYEKMKYSTKSPVYFSPAFWIAVAFLIFSTGNFFLFLFSKMLLQDLDHKFLYNNIYGFFTILKNILLCTAVVVAKYSALKKDEPANIDINLEIEKFSPYNKLY